MTLVIAKPLTLRNSWQPLDSDAATYITAVETADAQSLEEPVKIAIDNFVLGCKADGIWNAIKASCILAGARTLNGALVPLVGTAPTNFNFVSGDYNRKTGLVGNGSTKYLDSNRNNNADPQNSQHLAFYTSSGTITNGKCYMGSYDGTSQQGTSFINSNTVSCRNQAGNNKPGNSSSNGAFFSGVSRSTSSGFSQRSFGLSLFITGASGNPHSQNIGVFAALNNPSSGVSARIAFYSIGESLDLAKLDTRVTDLINAFGAAIP